MINVNAKLEHIPNFNIIITLADTAYR
jgi:hypothetical protein